MATPWCRLWADMPNDPKWRTIARVSGQRIGDVISTYVHMLICASNATERGRTQGWNDEDVATALDLNTEQVTSIREAMEGRVLDGDYLAGWNKRQAMREDESAAARAKAWREEQKRLKAAAKEMGEKTHANATEHNQTPEVEVEVEVEVDKKEASSKAKTAPKARKKNKTAMPIDFTLSEAVIAWGAKKGHKNLQAHFESFVLKAQARGYTYVNWDLALQNAIADDWAKLGPQARAGPAPAKFDPTAAVNRNRIPP